MTGRKRAGVEPALTHRGSSVLDWQWPVSPGVFKVYDKYTDVEVNLEADVQMWHMPVQGKMEAFQFAPGAAGLLQKKLVMLTQVDRSPSSIYKFTRSLLLNWPLYLEILEDGPLAIEKHWDEHVSDIDTAKAAKSILRLAISASIGAWRAEHKDLVKGLDTKANSTLVAQRGRIRRRENLLSAYQQTQLVRVLDTRVAEPELLEWQAEGLAALALTFQHGMRPVQLLALRVEHVRTFTDASGDPVCVVSFHTAKQKTGRTADGEMVRQVKPEWARPLVLLVEYAKQAGRTRLFCGGSNEQLWGKVKRVCAEVGVKVDFGANKLRHTSAQALADAGHSRKSIQWFLGHSSKNAATTYLRASQHQGNLINAALGTSRLYDRILSLSLGEFVTVEDLRCVREDEQIGAVVGDRLVAGIGRCRSGQSTCNYDPVTSCYGCQKYVPALNPSAHMEAIAGMREQVLVFIERGGTETSPAYLQLMKALAGAQEALDESKRILGTDSHG